jgi:hypothetical protein
MDERYTTTIDSYSELLATMFLWIQFVAVYFLTPALVSGCVSEDRERNILPLLLCAPLEDREILFGKLASRLGVLVLTLLAGLPPLALLQLIGGVSPEILIAAVLGTGTTLLSVAAVSLFWSATMARTRDAVIASYLTPLLYLLVCGGTTAVVQPGGPASVMWGGKWVTPPAVQAVADVVRAGNPFTAAESAMRALEKGVTGEEAFWATVRHYCHFHGLIALAFFTLALARLRSDPEASAKRRATLRGRWLSWARPAVGESPVFWREMFSDRGFGSRGVVRVALPLLFLLSFVEPVRVVLSSTRGVAFNISWSINEWVRLIGTGVACLVMLSILVRAALSVVREAERGTLDLLVLTDL